VSGQRWVIACARKYHGLGNRVRAVLGARVLARHAEREFLYVWPTGRHFGAALDDLWSVDYRRVPHVVSSALRVRYPYRDHSLTWIGPRAESERVWQIRTPHALALPPEAPPWESELRSLQPVGAVATRVQDFADQHLAGVPYVGVMVRAHPHSHQETLKASPVAWYVDRLSELRRDLPDVPFFLSCDTSEAAQRIQAAVPGCVSLADKGVYNSRTALQSAVADLYLLAGSVHVIGPHFSSFPELAVCLAGAGLRLETSRTAAPPSLRDLSLTQPIDLVRPHVREPVALG
jgi:hypothetical protein